MEEHILTGRKNKDLIEFELPSLPHKTIYCDVVGMPTPVLLGSTIHYHNYSDVTLYMQIVGSGAGWSGSTVNLGSLASGLDAYANLDNFMSRTRPAAAVTETITFTLKGYTDAGYSSLAYTFARDVTMVFIKSDDGSWTTDFSDNFDDGTVDGWNYTQDYPPGGPISLAVATDYVLSAAYSLKLIASGTHSGTDPFEFKSKFRKQFTTPNRTTVYAIINLRTSAVAAGNYPKNIQVLEDAAILIMIGRPYDAVGAAYFTDSKWIRIVVPLTPNATKTIYIQTDKLLVISGVFSDSKWMDDFKIISK